MSELVIGYVMWGLLGVVPAAGYAYHNRNSASNLGDLAILAGVTVVIAICMPVLVLAFLSLMKVLAGPMQAVLFHVIP